MDLRACLATSLPVNPQLKRQFVQFPSPWERQEAWSTLPRMQQLDLLYQHLKKVRQSLSPEIEAAARRRLLQDWSREIRFYLALQEREEKDREPKISTDTLLQQVADVLVPNFVLPREEDRPKAFTDKIVEVLYKKAQEPFFDEPPVYPEEDKDLADVSFDQTEFWQSFRVPSSALLQVLSEERLQKFLQSVVRKKFAVPVRPSQLDDMRAKWKDEFKRGCLRFLDVTHPDWKLFEEFQKDRLAVIDEKRRDTIERSTLEFNSSMMQDLLRPPEFAPPGMSSDFVTKLYRRHASSQRR